MSDLTLPTMDTSRHQLPLRAFVGGEFVDSIGTERHTLRSSVNNQVLTTG